MNTPGSPTTTAQVHLCSVCNAPTTQRCGGCRLLFYCSKEHITQDWKRHKTTCKSLKNSLLSTTPRIPTSNQSPQTIGRNTVEAIAFPANEDTPRMITIEWEWESDDDEPTPYRRYHRNHLFQEDAFVREKFIHCQNPGAIPLPDDRCMVVLINDNFLEDGSPLNRSIFNLTDGKAPHAWSDNVLAFRQPPQDVRDSRYSSAKLDEDLAVLKMYFLTGVTHTQYIRGLY